MAVSGILAGKRAVITGSNSGIGLGVAEALAAAGVAKPLMMLGLPDEFVEHGEPAKLLSMCGLDAQGIERSIRERLAAQAA